MSKKVMLRFNRPGPMSIGTGLHDGSVILIKPGINEVTAEQFKVLKAHPIIKARMQDEVVDKKRGKVKMLEVLADEKTDKAEDVPADADESNGLSSLNQKESIKVVGETYDTGLLREWADKETRAGVGKAIEKQLAKIEKERQENNDEEAE